MYRYYVRMRKGKKEIYGEAYEKQLVLDFTSENKKNGFRIVEINF